MTALARALAGATIGVLLAFFVIVAGGIYTGRLVLIRADLAEPRVTRVECVPPAART